jgi:excisionase family DNA binding protein
MGFLTTKQAAKRLGITPRRVQALIEAGRLPAQKFGRDYMIQEADLKLVEERKVGRPKKVS